MKSEYVRVVRANRSVVNVGMAVMGASSSELEE
jgi:hypothetical protein